MNKVVNKTRISLLAFMFVASVSACDSMSGSGSEGGDGASDPQAYEYKGAADPLMSVSGADRAGGLADRFDQIQGRQ